MIAYFDTSALVKLLIEEPGTAPAATLVAADGALLLAARTAGLATVDVSG